MKEIQYQKKYINKLATTAKDLLNDEYRDSGTIVFKAPTGSGKTYMVSQALTQMVKENPEYYAFENRNGDIAEKILWAIKQEAK